MGSSRLAALALICSALALALLAFAYIVDRNPVVERIERVHIATCEIAEVLLSDPVTAPRAVELQEFIERDCPE